MKKIAVTLTLIFFAVLTSFGAATARVTYLLDGRISVAQTAVNAKGTLLDVSMTINFSTLKVKHEEKIELTPCVVTSEADTIPLDKITIYGRNALIRRLRTGELSRPLETNSLDATSRLKSHLYRAHIPLTTANTSGHIIIKTTTQRKASDPIIKYNPINVDNYTLSTPVFTPEYVYAIPTETTVKSRRYQIHIDTETVNSRATTDSIYSFIDRIANNGRPMTGITVTASIPPGLKTKPSPECNIDSVIAIIAKRHPDIANIITTNINLDDWQGLHRWLERSSIQNRDSILSIINRYNNDSKICMEILKKRYPSQTSFLHDVIFPLLDDITITVTTTGSAITDIEEIERIYSRNPEDLSLYELCLYFKYLQSRRVKGCEAVMLKGVELYPEDTRARINAANVMMARGNLAAAQSHLIHAGSSAEAVYARGIFYTLCNDLKHARENFTNARALGILEAERAIKALDRLTIFGN